MTWPLLAALAIGTFALKAAGPLLLGDRPLPRPIALLASLLPAALLAALVMVQTVQGNGGPVMDARLAALGVACVALLLRAPFAVVVIAAVIAAAALRALP